MNNFEEIKNIIERETQRYNYDNFEGWFDAYESIIVLLGAQHIDHYVDSSSIHNNFEGCNVEFQTTHGSYKYNYKDSGRDILLKLTGLVIEDQEVCDRFRDLLRSIYNYLISASRNEIFKSNLICECGNSLSWPERNVWNKCEKCGAVIQCDPNVNEREVDKWKWMKVNNSRIAAGLKEDQ